MFYVYMYNLLNKNHFISFHRQCFYTKNQRKVKVSQKDSVHKAKLTIVLNFARNSHIMRERERERERERDFPHLMIFSKYLSTHQLQPWIPFFLLLPYSRHCLFVSASKQLTETNYITSKYITRNDPFGRCVQGLSEKKFSTRL